MCPNCRAPIRGDSDFCTNCGAHVRSASTSRTNVPDTKPAPGWPPQTPLPPGVPGQGQRSSSPAYKFDLKRLAALDLTIGGATIVVFVSLFLPWFGILGYATSGLSLHGYLAIASLAALALLGYLALRAGWETSPVKLPIAHAPLLLIGTGVQLLFVLIAFLQPDGLSHEFGAYLGLLAALVACGVIAVPMIRSTRNSAQPSGR
jgi:zinc-ribbon domain